MTTDSLDAAQVAAYLKTHPEFFERHPSLLVDLRIPHASGAAVSLVERQLAVLRERNVELHERLGHLLSVARDNDQLFEKMRGLVLAIMEARSLADMAAVLERELKARFQSEFVSLLVFDVDGHHGSAQTVTVAEAQAQVPALVKGKQAVAGHLRSEELTFLFGHEGEQVKSSAVIPLQAERPLGLLAIGSSNADHFRTSMDTLFISFVGEVLSRMLRPLLSADGARQSA
jgi:uncharacterized protein